MARHTLLQIPGPGDTVPEPIVKPKDSTPASNSAGQARTLPSKPATQGSDPTPSASGTVGSTNTGTVVPKEEPGDSGSAGAQPQASVSQDQSDALLVAIRQHEENVKKEEQAEMASTAAALLAKVRGKSGGEADAPISQPSVPPAGQTSADQSQPGGVTMDQSSQERASVTPSPPVSASSTPTPSEAGADRQSPTVKEEPGSDKKKAQKNRFSKLTNFSKIGVPQDAATKSTAAALLARIKAKKLGIDDPNQPSSTPPPSTGETPPPPQAPPGASSVTEWPPAPVVEIKEEGEPVEKRIKIEEGPNTQGTGTAPQPMVIEGVPPPQGIPPPQGVPPPQPVPPPMPPLPPPPSDDQPQPPPLPATSSSISGAPVTYSMQPPPMPPLGGNNMAEHGIVHDLTGPQEVLDLTAQDQSWAQQGHDQMQYPQGRQETRSLKVSKC